MKHDELFAEAERSLSYEAVLARGREEDRQEDREEGRQEGRQEGREEGRDLELLDLVRPLASAELLSELERIDDLEVLRARVRALLAERPAQE